MTANRCVVWKFDLEDGLHTVILEHGYWTGKRIITLDGKVMKVVRYTPFDVGSSFIFAIGAHRANAQVRWIKKIQAVYELTVDDQQIPQSELPANTLLLPASPPSQPAETLLRPAQQRQTDPTHLLRPHEKEGNSGSQECETYIRQNEQKLGANPNFYFTSAAVNLVMCALLSIWWGWQFMIGGFVLAIFYCGRGFWQRRKVRVSK